MTAVCGDAPWGDIASSPLRATMLVVLIAVTVAVIVYDVKLAIGAHRDRKESAAARAFWAQKRAE